MKLVILLSALMFAGCATQSFVVTGDTGVVPDHHEQQAFFVNGIGQKKQLNAAEICGGAHKVAKVEVEETFQNGFLAFITLGIYTPRDARVFCRK